MLVNMRVAFRSLFLILGLLPAWASTAERGRIIDCLAEIQAFATSMKALRDGGAQIPYSLVSDIQKESEKLAGVLLNNQTLVPEDLTNKDSEFTQLIRQKLLAYINIGKAGGPQAIMSLGHSRRDECEIDLKDIMPK